MAKMMMGQIDHARNRIRDIRAEKLGPSPENPDIPGKEQLHKDLLSGAEVVTPAQLRRAFNEYVNRIPAERVDTSSSWSASRREYRKKNQVTSLLPDTIDQAIVNVIYGKRIAAEIDRFGRETVEYDRLNKILTDRSAVVEDAIVLGDQHAALLALQEFAAFDPAATLATL